MFQHLRHLYLGCCFQITSCKYAKNKIMRKEENKESGKSVQLISAEPEYSVEYAPIVRVLLAVSYMGIFGGFMGIIASLLPIVSGKETKESVPLSVAAIVVFSAFALVMSIMEKRKRLAYENEQKRLLETAKIFCGNVVSCEKCVRSILYGNKTFDEITWRFVIEYKDENNDTVTVKSGRYLNDISETLKSRDVTVLKKEDGTYSFGSFSLKGTDKEGIKLDVSESKEEELSDDNK